MSLLGKQIKLKGKSARGKNRVREHGDEWIVLAETNTVLFAPSKKGPFLFIAPKGQGQNDKASRWVHLHDDENFEVQV